MDGQKQRRALTAAEQALRALAEGDGERAARAMSRAAGLDQVGMFAAAASLVAEAARDLGDGGSVGADRWAAIAAALGPGPLQAIAEQAGGDGV
jgi:uncharacterized protein HemY